MTANDGGKLADSARLLVETVVDAVGGWVRPCVGAAEADVKRLNAAAEAGAKLTMALGDIHVRSAMFASEYRERAGRSRSDCTSSAGI